MDATEDSDVPETGAVFTFGKSNFADNLPNKFWVKNDRVTYVACGDEHTALVVESGRVFMFGLNDWGQLGLGHDVRPGVNKPSCIKSLKHEKAKLVACGRSHTIISTASGHMYSCGSNSEGQLGIQDVPDLFTPRCIEYLEPTSYKMLSAGSDSSVALTEDGRVFVWGGNEDGKLGLGELIENAYEPEPLKFDRKVVCVACGYYHTAVVTDDGKLYTMGEAEGGKLGLPEDIENNKVPQHVTGIPDPVKWVACGSSHTVALTEFGECYVFGEGENGQLGLGTEILSISTPTHLPLPFKVSRVFCGQNFTALISEKGQLYTFGDGRYGKLAHGSDQYSNLYKPSHCKRFCHFVVDRVSCGGCHMIVKARTKINDRKVEDDEADEMKSLESKSLLDSVRLDGPSTLTRSLSARERRRNELQKSFSNISDLLPALTSFRKQTSLSATMPVMKSSQQKISGSSLNKTMMPKIDAIPNGKTFSAESSEGSQSEEKTDAEKKKMTNKLLPVVSPRQKPSHLQDGSDGDDENDSDEDDGSSREREKEDEQGSITVEESSKEDDEDEKKDIQPLESENESEMDNELEETNVQKEDGPNQDNVNENTNETTEQISNIEEDQIVNKESHVLQAPVVLPRKKKEQEDKKKETEEEAQDDKQGTEEEDDMQQKTDEEENSLEEENDKKHKDDKNEKDHKKDKKKRKNDKEDVEKKKEKKEGKKQNKKDEEDKAHEEENNNKAKDKKEKKKEEKDKKKKDEVKKDEKMDKKKDKTKKKDKKKEKADDKDKKKKDKNVDDEEDKEEKNDKEEIEDHNINKNDKDQNNKQNDLKITEEKDEEQPNKINPPKKSRLCVIL